LWTEDVGFDWIELNCFVLIDFIIPVLVNVWDLYSDFIFLHWLNDFWGYWNWWWWSFVQVCRKVCEEWEKSEMRMFLVRHTTGNEPRLSLNKIIVPPSPFSPASQSDFCYIDHQFGVPDDHSSRISFRNVLKFRLCSLHIVCIFIEMSFYCKHSGSYFQISFVCSSQRIQNQIEIFSHREYKWDDLSNIEASHFKCFIVAVSEWNLFDRRVFSRFRMLWRNKEQSLNEIEGVEYWDELCWHHWWEESTRETLFG
jgi:hypothetical protein